jgi:hypothetical protein
MTRLVSCRAEGTFTRPLPDDRIPVPTCSSVNHAISAPFAQRAWSRGIGSMARGSARGAGTYVCARIQRRSPSGLGR